MDELVEEEEYEIKLACDELDLENPTIESILKRYKQYLSENPSPDVKLNFQVFKLLKCKFSNAGKEMKSDSDRILQDMFSSGSVDESQDEIKIELKGFKSLYHIKFIRTLQKCLKCVMLKKVGEKIEMKTMPIKIPYARNQVQISPARIIAESISKRILKMSIIGHAGLIILMYHMKKIIESFLNSISETYDQAMKTSDLDFETDNELEEAHKSDEQEVPGEHREDEIVQQDKDDQDTIPREIKDDEEQNTENTKKKSDKPPQDCPECALLYAGRNLEKFLETSFTVPLKCTLSCYKVTDTIRYFLEQINQVILPQNLRESSEENLSTNLKNLFRDVLAKIVDGKASLFSTILEDLILSDLKMQSKIMKFWENYIPSLVENEEESFERIIKQNIFGRKNLIRFITSAGDFMAIWAAVSSLMLLQLQGVVLKNLLPPALHFVQDDLAELKNKNDFQSHLGITKVSQKLAINTKNPNIRILALEKEEKIRVLFENHTSYPEPYLYYDEKEKVFSHFSIMNEEQIIIERCFLDKVKPDASRNTLTNNTWKFLLRDNLATLFSNLKDETGPEPDIVANIEEKEQILKEAKTEEEAEETIIEKQKSEHYSPTITDFDQQTEEKSEEKFEEKFEEKSEEDRKSKSSDDDSSVEEDAPHFGTVESSFLINEDLIFHYWDPLRNTKERHFLRYQSGRDWPQMFGSPCAVKIGYSHAKVLYSLKESCAFAVLKGKCKICSATFLFTIEDNPFEEKLNEDGSISCKIKKPMQVDVSVTGRFFTKDGELDITHPVHDKSNAAGLQLRGEERRLLADMATQKGSHSTYQEQMAFINKEQIEAGNKTCVRGYHVIKQAMYEKELHLRGGETLAHSVRSVYQTQLAEESQHFSTKASKSMTGLIRSFQEIPFKLHLATHDQLKVGAHYFRQDLKQVKSPPPKPQMQEKSVVCIDSSGKFMTNHGKSETKKLHTALAIPPPAVGESPFPISEMISEENKTVDFLEFIQRTWSLMSKANNDENVNFPGVGITDFSFPNIHSFLQFFNKTKITDYLNTVFNMFVTKEKFPFSTVVTICQNHLIPVFLKTARANHADKRVADTFIAGFLKVLEAPTFNEAYSIWKDLVKIHCSKLIDHEARKRFKVGDYGNIKLDDVVTDFANDESEDEAAAYGKRVGIRLSSPFYTFFRRMYEKIMKEEEDIDFVENTFFAPSLVEVFIREYLSLFPFMSASLLEDGM